MEYAIHDLYTPSASIIYANMDTMQFMKDIPDNTIKLIITSPPYNIGKEYETRVSIDEYLSTQKEIISELIRILSPEGSICWQVGNYVDKGEVFPLDIYYYKIFKDLGMQLRNRIIWHFEHGLHASKRFSGRYETILWFTKSDYYTFNLDNVRVPSKYPGKRHFKGDKKGELSGNPKGKNPSDYWEFIQKDWDNEVWKIPNVKSNHPEKTNHPCQYPVELVERCVLALTNEEDIVFDPFSGVASTLIAAIKNNRKAFGTELSEEYVKTGKDRINQTLNGTIKTRPIGKPIHVPSSKDKVAQIPDEWKKRGNE